MRGPSLVSRRLLQRGLWLWLLTRLAAIAVVLLAAAVGGGEMPDVLGPMPAAILVTVALGFVDAHRLSERVLLANLGVAPAVQGLWLAGAATLGELALPLVVPQLLLLWRAL